jgi:hypothetical protein
MSKENQKEWPSNKREPVGTFQTPDTTVSSERSLAGPLRMGTTPGVGPRGAPRPGSSDFGTDRITPRGFDVIGTSDARTAEQEKSSLVSRDIRRGKRK